MFIFQTLLHLAHLFTIPSSPTAKQWLHSAYVTLGTPHRPPVFHFHCLGSDLPSSITSLQPVLHLPLLALDQLHFLKQLVLVHIWPHLGQGGGTERGED